MMRIYNYGEIDDARAGAPCGSRATKLYDNARDNMESILDSQGYDLDQCECIDDEIEAYCIDNGILFDSHGNPWQMR